MSTNLCCFGLVHLCLLGTSNLSIDICATVTYVYTLTDALFSCSKYLISTLIIHQIFLFSSFWFSYSWFVTDSQLAMAYVKAGVHAFSALADAVSHLPEFFSRLCFLPVLSFSPLIMLAHFALP